MSSFPTSIASVPFPVCPPTQPTLHREVIHGNNRECSFCELPTHPTHLAQCEGVVLTHLAVFPPVLTRTNQVPLIAQCRIFQFNCECSLSGLPTHPTHFVPWKAVVGATVYGVMLHELNQSRGNNLASLQLPLSIDMNVDEP